MKSQSGQLGRRATNAVMPISGALASGGRKTSFRGSTTFVPYTHEGDDSDDSDADEDSGEEEQAATAPQTVKPDFGNAEGTKL